MGKSRVYLEVPQYDELGYRQVLLSQPKTMSYNKGYDVDNDSYNKVTGCIDFKKSQWNNWYSVWVDNEPHRYYAYIKLKEDNQPIGEINFHCNNQNNNYYMGIVIENKYRGKGYSIEALKLLIKHAFEVLSINNLHNDFETTRISATKAHKEAGFKLLKIEDGRCYFRLTKDEYYSNL